MGKYLFLLVLVFGVVFYWRHKQRLAQRSEAKNDAPQQVLPMVACTHCQVHLDQSLAVQDTQGQWFCSELHRQQSKRI